MSESAKKTVNVPKDVNTLKLLFTRILQESFPHLGTLRERGWATQMIEILNASDPKLQSGGGGMRPTGIIRRVDELGRMVVPAELRRTRGVQSGSAVEIYVDELSKMIVIVPFKQYCHFCGSDEEVHEFKKRYICEQCVGEMVDKL